MTLRKGENGFSVRSPPAAVEIKAATSCSASIQTGHGRRKATAPVITTPSR
jgi:hypothetical protein